MAKKKTGAQRKTTRPVTPQPPENGTVGPVNTPGEKGKINTSPSVSLSLIQLASVVNGKDNNEGSGECPTCVFLHTSTDGDHFALLFLSGVLMSLRI